TYAFLADCDDALLSRPGACKLVRNRHGLVDLCGYRALVGCQYARYAGTPGDCAKPGASRSALFGAQPQYHLVAGSHYYGADAWRLCDRQLRSGFGLL